MTNNEGGRLGYFDYLQLAKEEFKLLVKTYPELGVLSQKELEVFHQLLSDKTLAQISEELYISYSSAHFHCKNIYRKLGISSRKQLLITYKDL